MNLQELIGELQTLALAYPGETPVYVKSEDRADVLDAVTIVSDETHLEIHLIG